MSFLLQRKEGGIQLAKSRQSTGTEAAMRAVLYHPDYAEHDMSKEVVLLHQLTVKFDYQGIGPVLQALGANGEAQVRVLLRSGNILGGSTTAVVQSVMDKWVDKLMFLNRQGAAVGAQAWPGDALEVKFDFWEEPLVINPYAYTVAVQIEQDDGGVLVFNDGDFYVEAWYKYVKATQPLLMAYMGWEALG